MSTPADVSTLETQFKTLTNNIYTYLSTSIGATAGWQNIAGNLTHIQASSAGFVWGVGSDSTIYYCKQPCTGNWVAVEMSSLRTLLTENIASVVALQVDYSFVYVLFKTATTKVVAKRAIDGTGTWSLLLSEALNGEPKALGVTDTYIWVAGSDSSGKGYSARCAKPCTTKAWIPVDYFSNTNVDVLSSNGAKLYGIKFDSASGKNVAFSADETGNSLSNIAGLTGITPASINAQNADKSLVVSDTAGKVYNCKYPCTVAGDLVQLDTNGRMPMSTDNALSATNNQTWMVSPSSGDKGNVYSRVDIVDSDKILSSLKDLDDQRYAVAQTLKNEYNTQTADLSSMKTVNETVNSISDSIDLERKAQDALNEQTRLEREIEHHARHRDGFSEKIYPIQILTLFVILALVVYLFLAIGSSNLAKMASAGILTLGLGVAIYFSVTNNTYGKSFIQSILPTP